MTDDRSNDPEFLKDLVKKTLDVATREIEAARARAEQAEEALASFLACMPREILPQA